MNDASPDTLIHRILRNQGKAEQVLIALHELTMSINNDLQKLRPVFAEGTDRVFQLSYGREFVRVQYPLGGRLSITREPVADTISLDWPGDPCLREATCQCDECRIDRTEQELVQQAFEQSECGEAVYHVPFDREC